jgi:hypothetical protein
VPGAQPDALSRVWCLRPVQVASTPCVLLPGKRAEVGITFVPSAAKEYAAVMPLRVMGLYDLHIRLSGACCSVLVRDWVLHDCTDQRAPGCEGCKLDSKARVRVCSHRR